MSAFWSFGGQIGGSSFLFLMFNVYFLFNFCFLFYFLKGRWLSVLGVEMGPAFCCCCVFVWVGSLFSFFYLYANGQQIKIQKLKKLKKVFFYSRNNIQHWCMVGPSSRVVRILDLLYNSRYPKSYEKVNFIFPFKKKRQKNFL